MIIFNKSCGADVNCYCDWDKGNYDEMVGRRSSLVAWRHSTDVFSSCNGIRFARLDTLASHGLTVVMQREQLLRHALAIRSRILGR